jgi:hypothetical protein
MLRCARGLRGHMAPADQFSMSDRGVQFKCCDRCRAEARRKAAIRGHPRCEHGKAQGRCLVCCPASAFGYYTHVRAKDALGKKLPVSRAQLLGCSTRDYAFYITGKLRDGMTLANHGAVWELDHIVPIMQRNADGNRPDQETIISRFHFTNVAPVLIEEHRVKTIAEHVARWMPPPPLPMPQLTDAEFAELMAELGIEV